MAKENRLVILKTANKLFRQGKIDSAIKEYNKILGIKPNDLEVRRIIGDLQLKQNNNTGAVEQFEWIADYYLKEGFFAKAIAMYKRITRIDPNYGAVSIKLAELYTKQGLIIEAKQIYLDLAEENKRKNNHKKALAMYKKILEFDRNNIKMRLLLADNYLREGLNESAITEYLTAVDILTAKKDFQKAEDLLSSTAKKIKDVKLTEKLANIYIAQGSEPKAINLLKELGGDLFKNINLLKLLGELYFKNNQMDEAEKIYKKITEISNEETEIIMKLGRVYLQRNHWDKTFELFLPVIDKNIADKKYEDATSLLRFIIASNNSYVPALNKLAHIFKVSGKKNNLIALYESLIPIYEQQKLEKELVQILEELIELSDSSFTYQEQLARLTGKGMAPEDESEDEREKEFINFNLRVVQDAIKESDFDKALEVLHKTAEAFPNNLDVRLKLFDVFQLNNDTDSLVDEGVRILDLYKANKQNDEYKKLFDKLYTLRPNDERLMDLTGDERTSIDITFDKEELQDNVLEISDPSLKEIEMPENEGDVKDVLVLSDTESMAAPMMDEIIEEKSSPPPPPPAPPEEKKQKEDSKGLSSVFTELDFYINDGYFGDAERLIEELREAYPGNEGLIERIQRLQSARVDGDDQPEAVETSSDSIDGVFDINESLLEENQAVKEDKGAEPSVDLGDDPGAEEEINIAADLADLGDIAFEIDMDESADTDSVPTAGVEEKKTSQSPDATKQDVSDEIRLSSSDEIQLSSSDDLFELGDEKIVEPEIAPETAPESILETIPETAPEAAPEPAREEESDGDLINFDKLMEEESKPIKDEPVVSFVEASDSSSESPFQDIEQVDISYEDGEDEIFKDDMLFLEEDVFHEIENQVEAEMAAIEFWQEELDKQRTSTIEKNMMEIFEEFKKGVEEKIGQEDYDTRYNLGIAYKEMGLVDEAIHEFLISAKHPLKLFDSAGLLGICFREKGMYDDAISWLEKAMEAPDRGEEEYLSIKYELVLTYIKKEDWTAADSTIAEIADKKPKFRDIQTIQQEVKKRL